MDRRKYGYFDVEEKQGADNKILGGGGDEQTFDVLQIGSVVQCSARGIGGYKARGPLRTGRQKQVSAAAG